jgi:hypothetical protein
MQLSSKIWFFILLLINVLAGFFLWSRYSQLQEKEKVTKASVALLVTQNNFRREKAFKTIERFDKVLHEPAVDGYKMGELSGRAEVINHQIMSLTDSMISKETIEQTEIKKYRKLFVTYCKALDSLFACIEIKSKISLNTGDTLVLSFPLAKENVKKLYSIVKSDSTGFYFHNFNQKLQSQKEEGETKLSIIIAENIRLLVRDNFYAEVVAQFVENEDRGWENFMRRRPDEFKEFKRIIEERRKINEAD